VVLLGGLALLGTTVLFGLLAWDRLRVDTPVTAVLQGEDGCAVSAVFTDPSGTRREVGLRPWRGSCTEGTPGDEVTVWYDASDPSVSAPDDRWWWPALVGLSPVLVVLWVAAGRGRRRPSGREARPPVREPRLAPASAVATTPTWSTTTPWAGSRS
jgi:hypothetical protein